jgi:hypothetical protein
MSVRWAVQDKMDTDYVNIREVCRELGLPCSTFPRVPFSKELPNIPADMPTIFYGSIRMIDLVRKSGRWSPCTFFDPETFKTTAWGPAYGEHWLNHGSRLTTLSEFVWEPHDPDRLFFVRPVRDAKEFTGGIWSFAQLCRWNSGLIRTDLGDEQLATIPIIVGEPWGIAREWRLFMVDGRVSAASRYKTRGSLDVGADVPPEVLEFGERMAGIFSPHRIFVLDICESADNLYVLELGCVNSAGLYAADVRKLIGDISGTVCLQEEHDET